MLTNHSHSVCGGRGGKLGKIKEKRDKKEQFEQQMTSNSGHQQKKKRDRQMERDANMRNME